MIFDRGCVCVVSNMQSIRFDKHTESRKNNCNNSNK